MGCGVSYLLRAGAIVLVAVGPVPAGVTNASARDEDLFVRPEDQHTVAFGSVDASRSVFVEGGFKHTPVGPLDRDGFVLMEVNGYGLTREVARAEGVERPALRITAAAAGLIGHQWNRDGLYVATYVGPELRYEQLAIDGRIERYSEPRLGVRAQWEVWAHPTPDTLITATVVAGSSRTNAYGRGSAGYRVAGHVFVGPELVGYVTPTYQETRIGAHVTGFSLGIVQGRLSAGWMSVDDGRRGSPYVGLTGWIRM